MKTTIDHEFVLGEEVYVMNNDYTISKGRITGINIDLRQYDAGNTIYTDIVYKVTNKQGDKTYRQSYTFATAEEAFSTL